ncbi:GNAT family N-acetyltransferase [Paenibacillus chartarius]|uniref:GNAT family N-acetyltransferase n=1 Tax=Paenibacillus chartarius TaxID=747481 RepID=A0ABV6DIC6_9BACL
MKLDTFPTLETERFILRKMTVSDAQAVFEHFSDGEVTKDMGIEPFTDTNQALELIHYMNGLFEERKAFRWGIVKKDDHALIGTCGFNSWEVNRGSRGEIAYDLSKPYWRQGYMTEVLKGVIHFGFHTLGLYRIEAFTNVDAAPSINFLQSLGFTEEGILRGYSLIHGEYADQRCFSLLRTEWNVSV